MSSQADFDSYARSVRPWLHREAYRLCGDWHLAEDLVQVTLHKLYRRWDRLTEHEKLTGYLRQALRNTYVSERRLQRWKYEIAQGELPEDVAAVPGDRNLDQAVVDRSTLIDSVNQLAPRQRAIIAWRFWADLSVEQTALMLGCSAGTVTSQTHHAMKNLRDILADLN
ncbi:SigE family RNA polymerase sigma factor [Plantactinospora soyae]|uniref:RNA polymerase sigma-70 factor (Sigma-E family) n=1 Tax=Plantactinospora soyae TaxID=1544732 RepID=A0A927MCT9_9ACTN|nr:SigE family RNA polymerase sigma factor [Plantactinospora soyae]MBE1490776.1 RNA polymerase sigma-70 factor (sigma-E family) [Plantactinospora soyae]